MPMTNAFLMGVGRFGGSPAASTSVYPQVRLSSSTRMLRSGTGALAPANGSLGTIGFRFRRNGAPSVTSYLLGATVNDTARVQILINTNGTPLIWLLDNTQTRFARVDASGVTNICDNSWHTVLASWDTSDTNGTTGRSLYVDSSDVTNTAEQWPASPTNVNYAATDPRYSFGASQTTTIYLGQFDIEFFWSDFSSRVDVTSSTNRDKFLAANIGANGTTPTGSTPDYFLVGPASAWNDVAGLNHGSEPKFFVDGTAVTDVGTPGTWP